MIGDLTAEEWSRLSDEYAAADGGLGPHPVAVYHGEEARALLEARVAESAARERLAVLSRETQEAVVEARKAGLSWQNIADMLGTSKQAVHQRFAHAV